jgi:cytochrome c
MNYRWIAAALGLAALASTAAAAPAAGDAAAGKELFSEQCSLCHSATPTPGGGGGGPDLNGVVGRKPASVEGFSYTRALKAKTAEWTPELLDTFLNDPQSYAPGTSMPVNLTEAKDRADVISYLSTLK